MPVGTGRGSGVGVWCTDRLTGNVLGLSNRLFALLGQSLGALGAPSVGTVLVKDGYVPSWLARSWATLLFEDLGDLVVACRPVPGRGGELRPLAVYRAGSPAGLTWARAGEQLSVYDLPFAPVLLSYAQFCSAGTGHTTTTLRPPAAGSGVSPVAARTLQTRSGLFPSSGRRPAPRSPAERRTA